MSEQDLVNCIISYIHLSGGIAIRINAGMRVLTDNGGHQRVFRGAPAGTADIIACYRGKFLAIECKQKGNRMGEKQETFGNMVKDAGGIHVCAYCLEDVIEVIDHVG